MRMLLHPIRKQEMPLLRKDKLGRGVTWPLGELRQWLTKLLRCHHVRLKTVHLACGFSIPEYSASGFISIADAIEFIDISTFDQPDVALFCITPIDNQSASWLVGLLAVQGRPKEKLTERLLLVGHLASQPLSQPVS